MKPLVESEDEDVEELELALELGSWLEEEEPIGKIGATDVVG